MTVGVIAILILAGLTIWWSNKTPETEGKTIRISYIPVSAYWPVDVLKTKQLFEKEGIKVEYVNLQSANQVYEAVARGEVDIVPVISALNILVPELIAPGNIKVFSISDMTKENAFDSIIVGKDSSIGNIKDLKGKKIGLLPGTTAKTFLKTFLVSNNIDISGVQFIELTPPNQLAALSGGSIDALYSYEPNTTIAIETAGAKRIYGSVFATQFNHSPIVTGIISNKLVSQDPELAKKAVEIVEEAYGFLDLNEKDTKDIIKTAFKLDQNVADKITLTPMGSSDNLDKERFARFADYLVSLGELKSKPDLSKLFYK